MNSPCKFSMSTIAAAGLALGLALQPVTMADEVLESFESYSDSAIIGNSFDNLNPVNTAPDPANVMATFGNPFTNVNDIVATTASPLAGNVSANMVAEWGQAPSDPFFAGAVLDFVSKFGSTKDLSKFTGAKMLLSAQTTTMGGTTGTSMLQLVVSDGTYSYASDTVALNAMNDEYSFLFSDPFTVSDRSGLPPGNDPSFSTILGNAQRIGFALVRSGFSDDVESITFDNITLTPEPASAMLFGAGLWLIASGRRRRA